MPTKYKVVNCDKWYRIIAYETLIDECVCEFEAKLAGASAFFMPSARSSVLSEWEREKARLYSTQFQIL